jgi:hypothetical protein
MLHVWYIYLQNWVIYGANVGKYSSTMEHMGLRALMTLVLMALKTWILRTKNDNCHDMTCVTVTVCLCVVSAVNAP